MPQLTEFPAARTLVVLVVLVSVSVIPSCSGSSGSDQNITGGEHDSHAERACVTTCSTSSPNPTIPIALEGQCDADAGTLPFAALCGMDYYSKHCALPSDCEYAEREVADSMLVR